MIDHHNCKGKSAYLYWTADKILIDSCACVSSDSAWGSCDHAIKNGGNENSSCSRVPVPFKFELCAGSRYVFCSEFRNTLSSLLSEKKCNTTDLYQSTCSNTEICVPSPTSSLGLCKCIDGYKRINDTCRLEVKPTDPPSRASFISDDDSSGSHVVATVLISVFVVAFALAAFAALVCYRYSLLAWIRNRMNQRNVDYDEFMIGQDADDDPPLN